ncbi:MAG: phosphatase PAP2 family protein [Candidatus Aminicenantes bacterium]|nr:phosphatase PAP2 family protein [Candidatus Aminicenantes bacterium]
MLKYTRWVGLPSSYRLVIISLSAFSLLQVGYFFIKSGKGLSYLPLNLLFICLFFSLPEIKKKFSKSSASLFILRVLPLAAYAYCYKLAGNLIHLVYDGWLDDRIAAVDRFLFGCQPNQAVTRFFTPWLSEIMLLAYVIYLPLVVILSYLIYSKKSSIWLEKYLLAMGLAYLTCFLIFIILPVASPRFYFSGLKPDSGFIFRRLMNLAESSIQYAGGSFPSAHCAAGTVMIFFARRLGRKYFTLYLLLVLLFFVSTVYGQYHYVADVISGMVVGLISVIIADKLQVESAGWAGDENKEHLSG